MARGMRWDRGRGGSTQFIKESTARNLRLLLTLGCRNLCELLTKEWRLFSLPYTPPRARPSPSGAPSTFSVTVARTIPLWKSTHPLPARRPTHPEIRNDDAAQSSASVSPLASVSGVSTCVDIDGLCFFFPTNLSQIRRVINLRPTSQLMLRSFGTPDSSLRYSLLLLIFEHEAVVIWKIDWLFEFVTLLYILQSSLIKIK